MPSSASSLRPMLASLTDVPLVQRGWVYEPKYDGIRAMVSVDPPRRAARGARATPAHVAIYSRNGHDKTRQFPALVAALETLAPRIAVPVILDGEIVAIDTTGRPLGFQHLQGRIHVIGSGEIAQADVHHPVALVIFDLLREDDEDLRGLPLAARRLRLQTRVPVSTSSSASDPIRLSEVATDDGRALMARARRDGWEGLVAKDGHSTYQSGRRSPSWRKIKLQHEQEFVVGGWTDPRETRSHFGAILVGYYERGQLQYAGSVGTGFDEAELGRLTGLFRTRARATSPFAGVVKTMEPAHWIAPTLLAAVRFTEWTMDGLLRHPVYLGLRDDKDPKDVRRETKAGSASSMPAPEPAAGKARGRRASSSDRAADLVAVRAHLEELERIKKDGDVALPNGDTLHVTNLAKVFWPSLGITKGELLRYYVDVAPLILPVVQDRPLVMKRFPNGLAKQAFYQQRHPEAVPAGVRREVLPPGVDPIDEDGPRDRLIGGSLTTLLYMAQLAAISQDPWFSRVTDPLHADCAGIDLDPGDGVSFERVLDVARQVKAEMDALGIPGVPKTSGSTGLHIYVPLPPGTTYDLGQLLCQIVATIVATKHPKIATVERMVKRRPRGTVYVDYLQNILGKTLATAYSARASDYAGVSTPLTWREVERGVDPHDFTIRTAAARFTKVGDLWSALRTGRPVDLSEVLRRAGLAAPTASGRRRSRAPRSRG